MGSQAARRVDLSTIPLFDSMGEIQIDKPVGDADLHRLRSASCYGDMDGAHVYVDVPNFADLASITAEGENYRRAKLHAPFYHPIEKAAEFAGSVHSTGTSLDLEECY
jgi:hypothetical protein